MTPMPALITVFIFIYGIIHSVHGIGRAFVNRPEAVPRRSAPLARPNQGRGRHHRRAVAASPAFHRAGQGSGKIEGTLEV